MGFLDLCAICAFLGGLVFASFLDTKDTKAGHREHKAVLTLAETKIVTTPYSVFSIYEQ